MTTALKIGIGATLGTGIIGGTAGITYALSQPKNLKEDLEKAGITLLNTNKEAGNSDDTSWEKLAKEHAKTTLTGNVTKISNLDIKEHTDTRTKNPGINQLKVRCDNLFAKTNKSEGYEQAKKDATNWCSKSSPLLSS